MIAQVNSESKTSVETSTERASNNLSLANRHLKVKFAPVNTFHKELKRRVDEYFTINDLSPKGTVNMYQKTLVIFTWFALSWGLLVFAAQTWWQAVILCISLGFAMGGIGFSVQHDGNHKAYSDNSFINQATGFGADLMGVSSYFWNLHHTLLHHSYTNVCGVDLDIDLGILARYAPQQERMWFHRFQHLYLPVLYSFLLVNWHIYRDFNDFVRATVGEYKTPRPKGKDLVLFIVGKSGFFALAFGIPCCFHPISQVIYCYLGTSAIVGLLLSFVFQTAHCMPDAKFVDLPADSQPLSDNWAIHQLETTVNYAPNNRLLSWYVGGLNYQVEHHLFPGICHTHYPSIATIVEATCKEYGVSYYTLPTFRDAIAAHMRWLWIMGNNDAELSID
jgi:linoleoyl-CoA desaturase